MTTYSLSSRPSRRPRRIRKHLAMLTAAGMLMLNGHAWAQSYPERTIRILVPFSPGGTSDVIVRPLCEQLTHLLGQSVVPEYRPGAGGTLAASSAASSAPDGYTLLLANTGALATGPHVTKVPYDPVKSFAPIGQLASSQYAVVVPTASPITSLDDLLKRVRAAPGQLSYGTPGVGSVGHLAGELWKKMRQVDMAHVPYRGQSQMNVDLYAGRLDVTFAGLGGTVATVQSGKVRALAVTGAKRSQSMPDTPTIAELGLPGYEASVFWGVVAPAGTPREIVNKLNTAINNVVQMNDVRKFWIAQGQDPEGGTPDAFGKLIGTEFVKWGTIVAHAGITQ